MRRNPYIMLATMLVMTGVAATLRLQAQHESVARHTMPDCPMMKEHDRHGMNERGEQGMGFSQEKTTHHFYLSRSGGVIQVEANDPLDTASRDQIRQHLKHIAMLFAEGNFDIPMFVHDQMPPGTADMRRLKSVISYRYEETARGGRVSISSDDAGAVNAAHEFLRFQITEHKTGDPLEVDGSL